MKKVALGLYVILLSNGSCTSDKSSIVVCNSCDCIEDSCTDYPLPPPPDFGYQFSFDTSYIKWVYGNPNNSDEFLYYQPYTPSGIPKTIKFNLALHEKKTIYEGLLLFPPKWGKKDWILLNPDDHVYKIKENGDSLTQLTFFEMDYSPEWNVDGTKFITEHVKNGFGNSIIYDLDGNILDTVSNGIVGGCWQQDSLIISPSAVDGSLDVTNVNIDSTYKLVNAEVGGILSCFWSIIDEKIYFTSSSGIYVFDPNTKVVSCLRKNCSNDMYISLSAFNQEILLMNKEHQKYFDIGTLQVTSKVVQINTDGSNEKEIVLY